MNLIKTVPMTEELETVVVINPEHAKQLLVLADLINDPSSYALVDVIITAGEYGKLSFFAMTMNHLQTVGNLQVTYLFTISLSTIDYETISQQNPVFASYEVAKEIKQLKSVSRLMCLTRQNDLTLDELVAFTNDFNIVVYKM
jgi:hypothetical protein